MVTGDLTLGGVSLNYTLLTYGILLTNVAAINLVIKKKKTVKVTQNKKSLKNIIAKRLLRSYDNFMQ